MCRQVYHFDKFFRTTEYECKELPDGRIYRNMVIDDPVRAPSMGVAKTVESIKVDKEAGEKRACRSSCVGVLIEMTNGIGLDCLLSRGL